VNKPIQESLVTLPLRAPVRKKKPPKTAKEALIEKVRARAGTSTPPSKLSPSRRAPEPEADPELEATADRDSEDGTTEAPGPRPSAWQRFWRWLRGK